MQQFLDKETRLDVLFNNAGVMHPADGSVTAQGYELQLGVNCLGSFLLTKLLTSILIATAKTQPEGKVRVVWVASSAAEMPYFSPAGGMPMDNLDYHIPKDRMTKYAVSKAGNYFHGTEYARRYKADGIVSVPLNPGNLSSDLWRSQVSVARMFLNTFVLHEPKYGAYTELFAGISDEVTLEKTGSWGESISLWLVTTNVLIEMQSYLGVALRAYDRISRKLPRQKKRAERATLRRFGSGVRSR